MPYAVITGATHGIGKAVAEAFLNDGLSIAVCARTQEDVEQCCTRWRQEYPRATVLGFAADLSSREEVEAFAAYIREHVLQVDILVNNAGLFFPGTLIAEPAGQLEAMMAVNVYSAYYLTRELLPLLRKASSGHIFNICSVASLRAYENGGSYSISKYALMGFSENLRHELIHDQIKVTAVLPGATWTRSWAVSGLPESRFMLPSDIAAMISAASRLSPAANVDTILIRPLEGDI